MATQAANLFVAIGADVGAALTGIRRVESAVAGMGGFIRGAAGNALGFAAATIGLNAFGGAADAARNAIFGMNGTLEQQGIAFRTLLGSQQAATQMLGELQTFANTTDLTFPQIATAAQRFLGAGVAAKDIIPLIRDVAGTSAAFGAGAEGVDRITRALQQMKSTGVVQLGEMNQLAEIGINAFDILAQHTGKSVAQIRKQLEGGKIKPEVFFAAFQANARRRGFDKVLAEQSRTLNGALSTIGDSLNAAGARAFLPFFELVREGANAFAAFTQTPAFDAFVQRVQDGVRGIVQQLGTFIVSVGNIANAHGLNVFQAALIETELLIGRTFGPEAQARFHMLLEAGQRLFDWFTTNGPVAFEWLVTHVPVAFERAGQFVRDFQALWHGVRGAIDTALVRIDAFVQGVEQAWAKLQPVIQAAERIGAVGSFLNPAQNLQRGVDLGRQLGMGIRNAPALPDQGTAAFGQRPITAFNAPLVQVQQVNASDPADVDAFLDRVAAELLNSQRRAENTAPAGLPGN